MSVDYDELFPALKRLLPEDGLNFLGDTTRFIRRLRSVSASMFVWSVVLSRFGQGVPGFDQARRWFTRLSETPIWPRPFQMRFKKPEAVQLFEQAFEEAVKPWRSMRRRLRHPLAQRFPDVVAWDSSLVQVADSLRKHFKGTRAAAASLKVVLGVSGNEATPEPHVGTEQGPLCCPGLRVGLTARARRQSHRRRLACAAEALRWPVLRPTPRRADAGALLAHPLARPRSHIAVRTRH